MELLCPNCQKKLTVPEQYAGQMMRCPLCQGTFTVPAMPSTVAAENAEPFGGYAPPPQPETYGVAHEPVAAAAPLPPISSETPSAASAPSPTPAASAPSSAPSAGYSRVCAMQFKPQVVQWLPLGLVVVFLLTFFPWISGRSTAIATAHETIVTNIPSQNAWSLGFGGVHLALLIVFDLLLILATLLAIASMLFNLKVIPDVPALRPFLPMRSLIVGTVAGLAWLFLTLQILIWLLGEGLIPLTFWGWLAWLVTTFAVIGAFLEFWLERRGTGKPLPRMSMEW